MSTFHVQPLNLIQNPKKVKEMDPYSFEHSIYDNPHIYM
jgi:hypothetical protein